MFQKNCTFLFSCTTLREINRLDKNYKQQIWLIFFLGVLEVFEIPCIGLYMYTVVDTKTGPLLHFQITSAYKANINNF